MVARFMNVHFRLAPAESRKWALPNTRVTMFFMSSLVSGRSPFMNAEGRLITHDPVIAR